MGKECSFAALRSQEYFKYKGSWYLKFSPTMVAWVKPASGRFEHVKLVDASEFANATVYTCTMEEALGIESKPRSERRRKLRLIGYSAAGLLVIVAIVLLLLKQ
jgi:hypothetical protein